jgi:predicted nucleotide-binding protein/uncharacterized SAM-dependent methyltransferase
VRLPQSHFSRLAYEKAPVMGKNKVFVVHGRNQAARDAMYSFLRALDLEPITWDSAVALTTKATPTTLEIVKAGLDAARCTVVLMTGDDSARLRPEYGQEPLLAQPRPNVLFEAGWALAIGGQERTVLVRFGGLREFSDISGLNFIELDNSREKRTALVHRLKAGGCGINEYNTLYFDPETAGNFDFPLEPDDPNPDVLPRGGFTDFIVDSLLSHKVSALDMEAEVTNYLQLGASPNLKYNYLGALGAQNWLNLSADPSYGGSYLKSALRRYCQEIVEATKLEGQRLDVVSLGPGDGLLDLMLLSSFQRFSTIAHYYPLDLSIELLQRAVSNVVASAYISRKIAIKAIHGDFLSLIRYKPIYSFDPAVNFMSFIGYTFGNHNEADVLGKLREAMNPGDFLLLDARLRSEESDPRQKLSKEQTVEMYRAFNNSLNNRFAFGPVEAATNADFNTSQFAYEVNSKYTSVSNALNIVTYVENINTKFRRSGKKLNKKRLDLAVTTIYDDSSLQEFFKDRGFDLVIRKRDSRSGFYLLKKPTE